MESPVRIVSKESRAFKVMMVRWVLLDHQVFREKPEEKAMSVHPVNPILREIRASQGCKEQRVTLVDQVKLAMLVRMVKTVHKGKQVRRGNLDHEVTSVKMVYPVERVHAVCQVIME